MRYINFPPGTRVCTSHFQFMLDTTWIVRHKQKAWAARHGYKNTDEIKAVFGPRWFYHLHEHIMRERIDECFPSEWAAMRSLAME